MSEKIEKKLPHVNIDASIANGNSVFCCNSSRDEVSGGEKEFKKGFFSRKKKEEKKNISIPIVENKQIEIKVEKDE